MTKITPPPIYDPVVDEEDKANLSWILFFNGMYQGDAGTTWTPTFVSLGSTGTPTFTGEYFRLSARLIFFRVVVTPATDTTSTAGTTYIDNFPLTIANDGVCHAVSANVGSLAGMVVKTGNRIYVPGWTAVTVPVTITGTIEAS
jgi:hypothetical protein